MKIEISDTNINVKSGVKNDRPWQIREQLAYMHQDGKKYPFEFKVTLDDNQEPYPVGYYELSPDSFYSGKFGTLGFSPVLVPIKK